MKFWSWAEIKQKVERECDLEGEEFVREAELLEYCNEAIDEAEAEIHSIYEDYFLTSKDIPVVSGDELFSMSTHLPDIFADKIRRIIFTQNSTNYYPVRRLKDWRKFEKKAFYDNNSHVNNYQYFIVNSTPGNPQINLVPKATETGVLKVWYLRNANRLTTETDVCDIPEFINFIFSHMRMKVFGKEGHPSYQEALERLERERERMTSVLANRVPDADNEIEMDLSYYEDMN